MTDPPGNRLFIPNKCNQIFLDKCDAYFLFVTQKHHTHPMSFSSVVASCKKTKQKTKILKNKYRKRTVCFTGYV